MRYAIINDGIVVNVAEAEAPLEDGWVQSDIAEINDQYDGTSFTKPLPDLDALAAAARMQRNSLLARSDWTQLLDVQIDRTAWAAYRQALRGVPSQPDFPLTIKWPTAPQ